MSAAEPAAIASSGISSNDVPSVAGLNACMSAPPTPRRDAAVRPRLGFEDLLEGDLGERGRDRADCDTELDEEQLGPFARGVDVRVPAPHDALCAIALWNSPCAAGVASNVADAARRPPTRRRS